MSITNWADLGGNYGRIIPFSRNPHSGSQALMDNLVMDGQAVNPALRNYEIGAMAEMISSVSYPFDIFAGQRFGTYEFGLGYTVYFFLRQIQQLQGDSGWHMPPVKPLELEGILPSHETILSGEYQLATRYYAVVRADSLQDNSARRIAEWLLTPEGQDTVHSAGIGRLIAGY